MSCEIGIKMTTSSQRKSPKIMVPFVSNRCLPATPDTARPQSPLALGHARFPGQCGCTMSVASSRDVLSTLAPSPGISARALQTWMVAMCTCTNTNAAADGNLQIVMCSLPSLPLFASPPVHCKHGWVQCGRRKCANRGTLRAQKKWLALQTPRRRSPRSGRPLAKECKKAGRRIARRWAVVGHLKQEQRRQHRRGASRSGRRRRRRRRLRNPLV
jgi:hypothetical protein